MKKWISSILLGLMTLLCITGCGSDDYITKVYELTEKETELLTSVSSFN